MKNTLHSKNLPLEATGIPNPFCNPKTKTTSSLKSFLALVVMVLGMGVSWGQINPTATTSLTTSSTVTEVFATTTGASAFTTGFPTTWALVGNTTYNTTTPSSTSSAGGWYANSDLGFLGSGSASNGNATWRLQNNTNTQITGFTISYKARMYKNNTGVPNLKAYYTTNASSTVPAQGATNFTIMSSLNVAGAATFSSTVNTTGVTLTTSPSNNVTGLTIANTNYIYIRFIFDGGSNSDLFSIDDVAITPILAAVSYTVTFDANTGSGTAMTNQTIATAASANLTSNTYTKAGYTFAGWNTLADGTGTPYVDGASYTMGTANVTLYAKWTANTLAITYNSQSGSAIASGSTTTGGSISASPGTPTRAGYTFNGWFAASTGGIAITFPYTHGQTSDFTLYAQWTINNNTIIWVGTNGIWSEPSNWSPSAPSLSNIIIISSGNPVLDTDFTIGSSGSLTISGSGTLTINSASVITISGTANFGGKSVTIKSDATGTGTIGQVTGTLTGATNVTVERYISNKRSWRALTAPVSTATSINANWQEGGTNNGINGFDIWSPTPGSGITTGGSSNSLLQYNSVNNSWIGIGATDGASSMMNGDKNKPFMAFVTGPYGSGNITNNLAAATTIRATGTILTGTKTYASASGLYSFIGNPYASPLNLTTMLASNTSFGGNIWVWDANVAGDYSVGTYNLFDNGTYSNISSNPNISGAQIQSGQAFFVKQSSGNSVDFSIQEAHKGATFSNAVFRDAAPAQLLRVGIYKQTNNEWSGRDGAMAVFLSDAEANQTTNKISNGSENVAFTKNSELFASEHHLPLVASDVLNVRVWNTTASANYKLKINTEEFETTNLDATLEDLFTNSRTPIALDGTAIEYPFAVTTDAASTGNRFRIVFQNAALGMNNPKANGITILPNPITGDTFQVNLGTLEMGMYTYSICNALGQEVETGSINNVTQNTNYSVKFKSNTAAGLYIMKVIGTVNAVFTAKLIKK